MAHRSHRFLVPLALTCAVLAIIAGAPGPGFIPHDSEQYLEFAGALGSGAVLDSSPNLSFGLTLRTPGFPMLLVWGALISSDPVQGVVIVHALLACIALFAVVSSLRRELPPFASGLAVAAGLYSFRDWAVTLSSEWSALCLLLIVAASMIETAFSRKPENAALSILWVSLLVLVRPVFSFLYLVSAVWAWFWMRSRLFTVRSAALCVVSILPVVLWAGVNHVRWGRWEISPGASVGAFGAATLIGPANVSSDDTGEFRNFAAWVNRERQEATGEELQTLRYPEPQSIGKKFVHNYWDLSHAYQRESGKTWIEVFDQMGRYAANALRNNSSRYFEYIGNGLRGLFAQPVLVTLCALVPLLSIRRRGVTPLALVTVTCLGVHLIHVALCAATTIIQGRFFGLTGALLLTLGCCSVLDFLRFRRASRD